MSEAEGYQLEQERLERTLEALDEINGCGLTDIAKFMASELGVSRWWKPDVEPRA